MVFTCLVLSVFSTIKDFEEIAGAILLRMEIVMVIWFTIEFFCRLWSAGCRSRYQGWMGRLRFLRSPFCVIGECVFDVFPRGKNKTKYSSLCAFQADCVRGLPWRRRNLPAVASRRFLNTARRVISWLVPSLSLERIVSSASFYTRGAIVETDYHLTGPACHCGII